MEREIEWSGSVRNKGSKNYRKPREIRKVKRKKVCEMRRREVGEAKRS